jgi:hypothetical protein
MGIMNINVAETWESVYDAFDNINFASYDFAGVKDSLLNYLKVYYPENFNDYSENSLMVAIIETFAYAVELIAYRVDMASHENFISEASRKKNILSLAKYISYTATRNIPLRGLVKIDSISTTEELYDSRGENLTNKIIKWNDPNNQFWKEQFILVINKSLTTRFGQPVKTNQVDNTVFQVYTLNNTLQKQYNSFKNGVYSYYAQNGNEHLAMELVSSDIDDYGVLEKEPDLNSRFNITYMNDGLGDSSPMTGFMMYTKQGSIKRFTFNFSNPIPNTFIDINVENVNDIDVWVQTLDYYDGIVDTWEKVETLSGQNVFFNNLENRLKYEIETREDDKIRVIFGDGDFSDMPTGNLAIWVRQSENRSIQIPKNKIVQSPLQIGYDATNGQIEHVTFTYSLTTTLQNNSESESIERIRYAAPKIFYTQNRMVNGEDYNTYLLKDPSVLKLKAFNRTYVGQSRYLTPTDASGKYQGVKVFGDDMRIFYEFSKSTQTSTLSSRLLVDNVIEPLLSDQGVLSTIQYINAKNTKTRGLRITPRTRFYEDRWYEIAESGELFDSYKTITEKTLVQKYLDMHWYGNYTKLITTDDGVFALVDDDTDFKIYDSGYSLARTVDGEIVYYSQQSGMQSGGSRANKFGIKYRGLVDFKGVLEMTLVSSPTSDWIVECVSISETNQSWHVKCSDDDETHVITTTDYLTTNFSISDLSFKFTNYDGMKSCFPGDAFIIRAGTTAPIRYNVQGEFVVTTTLTDSLSSDTFNYSQLYTDEKDDNSWLLAIERIDDIDGNTLYWQITNRETKMIGESTDTTFWYDNSEKIVDSSTQEVMKDGISILKSNLNAAKTKAIGENREFHIQAIDTNNSGDKIYTRVVITPSYEDTDYFTASNVNMFSSLIDLDNDYVYFTVEDGVYYPLETATAAIVAKFTDTEMMIYTPADGESDQTTYARRLGRSGIDFMWAHYAPSDNIIDASTTNINDIYVLTKGYYNSMISYVRGLITDAPSQPTTLELKNSYSELLQAKMMSDTIVLQSAIIKLLFGPKADKQLRCKFKVIRNPKGSLSDETVKAEILTLINAYFTIEDWSFGETFYAQDMLSTIQTKLSNEVLSIVLVPTYANNNFGNMLVVDCGVNEILQTCATVDDIEVVASYSNSNLRIKQ